MMDNPEVQQMMQNQQGQPNQQNQQNQQNPFPVNSNMVIPDDNVFFEQQENNNLIRNDIDASNINNNNINDMEEEIQLEENIKDPDIKGNAFAELPRLKKYQPVPKSEEEIRLLGKKVSHKDKKISKGLAVNLIGKNIKAKTEPTKLQQVFNMVCKTNNFEIQSIKNAAFKVQYDIDDTTVKLLADLGKARVSVKKLGIPTGLCKKKFHLYCYYIMPEQISIVTDDKIVWNAYFGLQFNENERYRNKEMVPFRNLLTGCNIRTFSIVSNKLFENKKTLVGYCQDEEKNIALITNGEFYKKEIVLNDLAQQIAAGMSILNSPNTNFKNYNLYQTNTFIVAFPSGENLNANLRKLTGVECIQSKNHLALGLKNVETNSNKGSYLNLHEIRLTDFSPSCLFISPFKNYGAFIEHELEINAVYNAIGYNDIKNLQTLQVPDNFVFWDNIGSYIELISLIRIAKKPNNVEDDNEFKTTMYIIELYTKYKSVIAAWKQVYSAFEYIILSFYDGVTNKLTIDGITRLRLKVDTFLANYEILKTHASYNDIARIVVGINNCRLMKTFVTRTAASDAVIAIQKVIKILMSAQTEELEKQNTNIETIIRTTAIMCLECLYDGYWAMIPKVRSRCAFLGDVTGDMINDNNIRENIANIFRLFEEKNAIQGKEIDFLKQKDEIDNLIDKTLDNTLKDYNNEVIRNFIDPIKKKAMSDPVLYRSMVEDILSLKNDPDINDERDIIAYGNFNENPDIMGFLAKANEAAKLVIQATVNQDMNKIDKDKVIDAVTPTRKSAKKMLFKNSLGRKKKQRNYKPPPLANSIKNNNITINPRILRNAVAAPAVSGNAEQFEKIFKGAALSIGK